jgi:hypothetical protein
MNKDKISLSKPYFHKIIYILSNDLYYTFSQILFNFDTCYKLSFNVNISIIMLINESFLLYLLKLLIIF